MIFSPKSTMRLCAGKCKTRRSTTQFDGASAVCRRCVLRAPKPVVQPRVALNGFTQEVTKL